MVGWSKLVALAVFNINIGVRVVRPCTAAYRDKLDVISTGCGRKETLFSMKICSDLS